MIHFSDWEFGLPRQHRGPVATGLQATVKTLNAPLLPPRHRGLITAPPRLVNPCSIRPGSTLGHRRPHPTATALSVGGAIMLQTSRPSAAQRCWARGIPDPDGEGVDAHVSLDNEERGVGDAELRQPLRLVDHVHSNACSWPTDAVCTMGTTKAGEQTAPVTPATAGEVVATCSPRIQRTPGQNTCTSMTWHRQGRRRTPRQLKAGGGVGGGRGCKALSLGVGVSSLPEPDSTPSTAAMASRRSCREEGETPCEKAAG